MGEYMYINNDTNANYVFASHTSHTYGGIGTVYVCLTGARQKTDSSLITLKICANKHTCEGRDCKN